VTKLEWGEVTRAVCGSTGRRLGLTSAFVVGHPELDTRPGGTGRPLTGFSIDQCYSCGYTAGRISDDPPAGIRAILASRAYREVLEDEALSPSARQFLARSVIDEQAGDPAAAGWAALKAAWMCDDDHDAEAARRCRARALTLFRRAASEGRSFAPDGNAACVVADLLRRTRRFDEAVAECERALGSETDQLVRSVLSFQLGLARARDDGRHDLGEVPQVRS
jgi:hypothetical protein